MTELCVTTTIGDVVSRDLRSAAVFSRYGIDFCCGGHRTIEDACRTAGEDPGRILRELAMLEASSGAPDDRSMWSPARMLDHVLDHHHAYVRRQVPIIQGYLTKLVGRHRDSQPTLLRVQEIFTALASDLVHHMEKEEQILFPFIRALIAARAANMRPPLSPFGTIQNPVRMMEAEHQQAGHDLWLLRDITNGFQPPADGCATWRACYAELEAFERDLHEHVHLENNLLFPAAARLEDI